MGTPDFAVPTLEALIEKHEVVAVFTQPDRVSGRGKKLKMPPVKQVALQHEIAVYQPEKIGTAESSAFIQSMVPDVIVVVAYGQLISPTILNIPHFGCLNLHASLLPRWRGASPIQTAIVAGDMLTGVTIMQMDRGLDTGAMLMSETVTVTPQMTGGQLHDILMAVGAKLLIKTLDQLVAGSLVATPQEGDLATYAPKIDKAMARIDWSQSAEQIVNLVRGYNPWPSAYCSIDGRTFKIHAATALDRYHHDVPGVIVAVDDVYIYINSGEGVVRIDELQPQNSKKMSTAAYLRGHSLAVGQIVD